MKLKRSKAGSKAHSADAIRYQVSIRGPRAGSLTNDQCAQKVFRALNGDDTAPFEVRIKVWRGGNELDWQPQNSVKDEARAAILRNNLRRALQQRRIAFRKMGHSK